jgi:hypothetical protein
MTQQEAIQHLAMLVQELCTHLMGTWQPEEEYQRRISELADIARRAREIDQTVRDS